MPMGRSTRLLRPMDRLCRRLLFLRGSKRSKVAAIDVYTERPTAISTGPGSSIKAIVEDGNGGWFIAGLHRKWIASLEPIWLMFLSGRNVRFGGCHFHPDPNDTVTGGLHDEIVCGGGLYQHWRRASEQNRRHRPLPGTRRTALFCPGLPKQRDGFGFAHCRRHRLCRRLLHYDRRPLRRTHRRLDAASAMPHCGIRCRWGGINFVWEIALCGGIFQRHRRRAAGGIGFAAHEHQHEHATLWDPNPIGEK